MRRLTGDPQSLALPETLQLHGIDRRKFLKFCSTMVTTLALPSRFMAQTAQALANVKRPVLVWLEFSDCAGNSESMLRASTPSVAEVVLNVLSWEYHETIMAGAGKQAEATLQRILKEERGKFIAVVEGAIPMADGGIYCTIGGRTALDIAREVCSAAAATIAVGACAWDGGLVAAHPNPTGAVGLEEAVPGIKVVNLGGCPHNPVNTAAVLTHYLTFKEMPALDQWNRPLFAYGNLIHDHCERRAHYDAGRYVQEWGDEGHRKGYCLYKMGCKGPESTYNCPVVRWNGGTSWPIKAGHGCIGCATKRFWDTRSPFYERLPNVPGFGVDVAASNIGWTLTGATAALTIAHSVGQTIRTKVRPPAPAVPEHVTDVPDAPDSK